MAENSERLNELLAKLEYLTQKQETLSDEVNELRNAVKSFTRPSIEPQKEIKTEVNTRLSETPKSPIVEQTIPLQTNIKTESVQENKKVNSNNLEKFIGENLANKIGIIITILGVSIGAKYAIDHQLISPLTRIILGYLVGLGLLGFALKLKKNYENFSAVLLSGAMAILYFLTFAAYSFYALIPQTIAFSIMVFFTVFTVVSAINYNRQVIAHIGLVGAYAVPFLLSNNSGNALALFTYMSILNAGILFIAFKKYWKVLYYVAFGLSWLIYLVWFNFSYVETKHFGIAFSFAIIFFGIFYATLLSIKLVQKESFRASDVVMLLLNSFIFYGIGAVLMVDYSRKGELDGLYTVANALIHFGVCVLIYKTQIEERKFFYLVGGLVLVFITIAIPIQLDGNWVTLLWIGEATLLYWIGRTKEVPAYEKMAYPLMWLAFFSILHDWSNYTDYYKDSGNQKIIPLFNIYFLTTLFLVAAYGFMTYLNRTAKHPIPEKLKHGFFHFMSYLIPLLLFMVLYLGIQMEISCHYHQLFQDSRIDLKTSPDYYYTNTLYNYDLYRFKGLWQFIFSLVYFSGLLVLFKKKSKNRYFDLIPLGLITFTVVFFLIHGLLEISNLRENYISPKMHEHFAVGTMHLFIRYIAITALAFALFVSYRFIKESYTSRTIRMIFDLTFNTIVVWVASSELIQWMDLANSTTTYKLGLSILWGVYALFMVSFGIWKKRIHMRIGAIVLFTITLIKLFSYDIAQLDTIAKTIVFVSLGILLLIISFLYNKYKHLIADETHS